MRLSCSVMALEVDGASLVKRSWILVSASEIIPATILGYMKEDEVRTSTASNGVSKSVSMLSGFRTEEDGSEVQLSTTS